MKKGKAIMARYFMALSTILMFILALASISYSAPFTCNATSKSTSLTRDGSNTIINITYGDDRIAGAGVANFNGVNITVTLTSTATANTSVALEVNMSNGSKFFGNISINTTGITSLEDGSYTLGALVWNGTNAAGDTDSVLCANKTVTVDRTVPQAPTSLSPTGRQTASGDVAFSSTVNGANTTGCTLEFEQTNPGSSAYPMTHSANSCSLTLLSVPDQVYRYSIRATDGINTTLSATEQIQVDVPTNTNVRGGIGAAIAQGKVKIMPDKAGGLQIASNTPAGERSQGLQNAIDRTNANFQKELTKEELKKTGTGAGIGAAVGAGIGMIGFAAGPLGVITVPIGASLGALIGGMVGASR